MMHARPSGGLDSWFATLIVAFAGIGVAPIADARGLLSAVRLPQEVIVTPVLEGVLMNGLAIEMLELDIGMPLEIFLSRLAPLLPEHVVLTVSHGVSVAQWDDGSVSIALYAAKTGDRRAVGALTAMRVRETSPSVLPSDTRCGDPVARHLASVGYSYPLFDLQEAGGSGVPVASLPGGLSPSRPLYRNPATIETASAVRIRGFVIETGVDALAARLLHAMPREGWTTLQRNATSIPERRVSLVSACGRRRLKLDSAHMQGRTMAIAFESGLRD